MCLLYVKGVAPVGLVWSHSMPCAHSNTAALMAPQEVPGVGTGLGQLCNVLGCATARLSTSSQPASQPASQSRAAQPAAVKGSQLAICPCDACSSVKLAGTCLRVAATLRLDRGQAAPLARSCVLDGARAACSAEQRRAGQAAGREGQRQLGSCAWVKRMVWAVARYTAGVLD